MRIWRVSDLVRVGRKKDMIIDPMQSAHAAPGCGAKSKRTGKPCPAPAGRGCRVCRMHGAGGGGRLGRENGNYRHGGRTKGIADAVRGAARMSLGYWIRFLSGRG